MTEAQKSRKLLGSLLIEKGLIAEPQLEQALAGQKRHGGRLGYWVVRLGFVPPPTLAAFLTEHRYTVPFHEKPEIRQKASEAVPRSVAFYYKIAPLKIENRTLTVALSEAGHEHLTDLLSEITGYRIDALMLPEAELRSLLESSYGRISDPGMELSAFDENTFIISDARKNIKAHASSQLKEEATIGERLRSLVT